MEDKTSLLHHNRWNFNVLLAFYGTHMFQPVTT